MNSSSDEEIVKVPNKNDKGKDLQTLSDCDAISEKITCPPNKNKIFLEITVDSKDVSEDDRFSEAGNEHQARILSRSQQLLASKTGNLTESLKNTKSRRYSSLRNMHIPMPNCSHNIISKESGSDRDDVIRNLQKNIERHRRENQKCKEEIIAAKEENLKIYKTCTEANKSIQNFNVYKKELQKQAQVLQQENEELQAKNCTLQQQIITQQAKLSKLSEEHNQLSKQNKYLSREETHLNQEIQSLEIELKTTKNCGLKLEKQIQDYENKIQILANSISSLNEEKSLLENLNEEMKNNADVTEASCSNLRTENARLLEENERMKFETKKLHLKLEEIKGQTANDINSLRRKLMTEAERAFNLEQQVLESSSEISHPAPSDFKQLQDQMQATQKKCRDLKKVLKLISLCGRSLGADEAICSMIQMIVGLDQDSATIHPPGTKKTTEGMEDSHDSTDSGATNNLLRQENEELKRRIWTAKMIAKDQL